MGRARAQDRGRAQAVDRARHDAYLRTHILPRVGTTPIGPIGHLDVREFVADRSALGLAPATVHRAHQILNKSLRAAVDARLIVVNPAERPPLPRIERHEMGVLDPAEVRHPMEAAPSGTGR